MSGLPQSLVLVGAGKMGGALLQGWLELGLNPATACVLDPYPSADLQALAARHGVRVNPPLDTIVPPEVLVLAIKPQTLEAAAPDLIRLVGAHTLLVSILAGKSVHTLSAKITSAQAVIRAMPNTPASVGRGITGLFANAKTSADQKHNAEALLAVIGHVEWVDQEALIDAVTAVSGSGPAYVFYLVECMTKAGMALGLDEALAGRLARATVEGSGELLFRDPATSASVLRQNVTSPGGTTAAALAVLMAQDGLEPLMVKALAAARQRAVELSV